MEYFLKVLWSVQQKFISIAKVYRSIPGALRVGMGYCLLCCIGMLSIVACGLFNPASKIIDGDDNPKDSIVLRDFTATKIYLYSNCNAKIEFDSIRSECKLFVNPNLKQYLKTSIKDSVLIVRLDPDFLYTNVRLEAYIRLKEIKVINCQDSARTYLYGFMNQESTTVMLSANSKFLGSFNKINQLKLNCISGIVDSLYGSGESLTINAFGGSRVIMGAYPCKVATVTMDQGSSGRIKVSDTLKTNLNNYSILYYIPAGNPVIRDSVILNNSSLIRDTLQVIDCAVR